GRFAEHGRIGADEIGLGQHRPDLPHGFHELADIVIRHWLLQVDLKGIRPVLNVETPGYIRDVNDHAPDAGRGTRRLQRVAVDRYDLVNVCEQNGWSDVLSARTRRRAFQRESDGHR